MTREEQIKEAAEDYSAYRDATDEEDLYNSTELEAFKEGAEWADNHPVKSEDNVILSFHVCNIPWSEEVLAGANAKYDAYFVSVPKNLIPKKLLEVITTDSHYKYISQVALLKDGLV